MDQHETTWAAQQPPAGGLSLNGAWKTSEFKSLRRLALITEFIDRSTLHHAIMTVPMSRASCLALDAPPVVIYFIASFFDTPTIIHCPHHIFLLLMPWPSWSSACVVAKNILLFFVHLVDYGAILDLSCCCCCCCCLLGTRIPLIFM